MATVSVHSGKCEDCGREVPMHIYRPKAQFLRQTLDFNEREGIEPVLSEADRRRVLAEAQELDAQEQADGEVELAARMAEKVGALFVDGRQAQSVLCPHCGAVLMAVVPKGETVD